MKRKSRRISVPMVVTITLVTVTTLLLGSFATGSYIRERDHEYELLRAQAEQMTVRASAAFALPLWNIDNLQIEKIMETACLSPAVRAIIVEGAGRTRSQVARGGSRCVAADRFVPTKDLIVEQRDITFNDEKIGMVRIFMSPQVIEDGLRRSFIRTIVTILLLDALLVFFVYLVLWIAVLQPLAQIEKYALAVTAGERSPELELSPSLTSDLANLRASIERMVQLQESLRRSEMLSAMGTLVGGVAHEIRNPLFAITALLDAYADEIEQMNASEFSGGIREQVAKLNYLTRDLLEYGRPVRISRNAGSLESVIADAVRSCDGAASAQGVAIRTSIGPPLPQLEMDRDRLLQVYENLLANAIHYAPKGTEVTVSVNAIQRNGQPVIESTIEDSGPGFGDADLRQIFEPFYSHRPGGTGLGLSIVERVVHEHDGTVTAGNRPDGGAIVSVRLPARGSQPTQV